MPSAKKPPMKLVWFEHVTDWLAGQAESPPPQLPEGVSRPGMSAVLGMVLRATRSETSEAVVSARWVEAMTGVNRGSVLKALAFLEAYRWLSWTQRRRNRVKVYEITFSPVVTNTHHLEPSGDTSGDGSGDDYSHTPGTPGTPLEDFIEEEDGVLCVNCEVIDGHEVDCPEHPFDSDSDAERRRRLRAVEGKSA